MRVADYIISRLADAGIDHVFGVCGGGSIFLNDALRKSDRVNFVAMHHEQACSMAAESYARARNGIGCAIVTSGPGGTNAITGVAGAWCDSVPTITISGQVFSKQTIGASGLRTLGVQEIDIVSMVKPITKYAVMVRDPLTIRRELERCLWLATNGRPGPCWLDIPADVQNADINPDDLAPWVSTSLFEPGYYREAHFAPKRRETMVLQVAKLVDLLRAAKRPLIHIGQGIRLADAIPEFFQFIEAAKIPVVTARNGADIIASDHPLYVGRPGTFAQRGANFAVQTCDLYIAIGTRLSLAQTGYNAKDYARNATVVQVDIDRAELDKDTVPIDLKIAADCGDFLRELIAQTKHINPPFDYRYPYHGAPNAQEWPEEWIQWLAQCKEWQARYVPGQPRQHESAAVDNYDLIEAISDIAQPDDIIVTDMGTSFQNVHAAFKIKQGQRLMTNCGLAAMGWGLPAAIGAAVGTGRRVIAIIGDGGAMMNLQELATLAHHKLNVKIFLLNNNGYCTMKQSQEHAFGAYMGSDPGSGLSFPNFMWVASSVNIPGAKISRIKDALDPMFGLIPMLESDGPWLIEFVTDPDQATIPKSINRRLEDGTLQQTALEDSWPYLPPEEVAAQLEVANRE